MNFVDPYQTILNDPILLGVAVILSAMVVYSILKKLFKLAIILVACLIIYLGYLMYTGQPIPGSGQEVIDKAKKDINKVTDGGLEKLEEVGKDIIKNIKDKTK